MCRYKIFWFILVVTSLSLADTIENKTHTKGKFLGSKPTTMPSWFQQSFLDLTADVADSAEMNKSLIVYFHQDGCPYCNLLVTKNFANPKTKAKIQKSLNVLEINMWGDREVTNFSGQSISEKQFAIQHKVQFTPTLLFFNQQGKQILRLNGYLPIPAFNLALDYVINPKFHQLSFDMFQQQNSPAINNHKLIPEPDLFAKPPYILLQTDKSKPLAVFFESKNCQTCIQLHQKNLSDSVTRKLLKQYQVVQLDKNSNTKLITPNGKKLTAKIWAQQLKITFTPTVIFFVGGQEIIRAEAMFKIFHFQSIVDYVHSGSYTTEPQFQRYISNRADEIIATGKNVNIWQ